MKLDVRMSAATERKIKVVLFGLGTPVECERIDAAEYGPQPVFTFDQAQAFLSVWNREAEECANGYFRGDTFYFESYNGMRKFANKPDAQGMYRLGATCPRSKSGADGPWIWHPQCHVNNDHDAEMAVRIEHEGQSVEFATCRAHYAFQAPTDAKISRLEF